MVLVTLAQSCGKGSDDRHRSASSARPDRSGRAERAGGADRGGAPARAASAAAIRGGRGGGSQSAPGRVAGRSSAAAAAADSTIFFVRAPASPPGPSALYAVGPDGRGERLLARNAGGYAWSRDRQKLAFVSGRLDAPRVVAPIPVPPGNGNLDIYAMNVDGSGRQRLTRTPAREDAPYWSP